MPEEDIEGMDFYAGDEEKPQGFFLKGSNSLDWGMKNRLARIFSKTSGRTVMLAVDHGYFQGSISGLERIDRTIVPIAEHADSLMLTRGALRSSVPPSYGRGVVLRASGGPSVLKELSNEELAMDMEDALRLNACALAVQVFIGGEFETKSVHNMTRLIDAGMRVGMPTLAVTAVGRDMARSPRYFRLACRICAELGAQIVKTYYVDKGFETITSSCPVPIVMAGGKKIPEAEALTMAAHAIDAGAAGVDMGRNIFQSSDPAAMIQAVGRVVHDRLPPDQAYELFCDLKQKSSAGRV